MKTVEKRIEKMELLNIISYLLLICLIITIILEFIYGGDVYQNSGLTIIAVAIAVQTVEQKYTRRDIDRMDGGIKEIRDDINGIKEYINRIDSAINGIKGDIDGISKRLEKNGGKTITFQGENHE
ncbi:MAG: hypothetical protein KAU14_07240 [Thermoplasmata archaeon]|nr:hypothetical protein [Thermoplasmata archaeon]